MQGSYFRSDEDMTRYMVSNSKGSFVRGKDGMGTNEGDTILSAPMEIAFVSSSRLQAEVDKEKMGISRLPLKVFYDHPNNFVSTMLVGNNIALVVYGILIARLFDNTIFKGYSASFTVPADTILSTFIVLITGEFLPKTFFKSNPNKWLRVFSFPAFFFYVILWPISRFSTFLSRLFLRMMV